MSASIDNLPPPTYKHLKSKAKKQQQEEEKNQRINRENTILLNKLSRIAGRKGAEGSGLDKKSRALLPGEAPQKGIGSLNKNARIQSQQKIQRENQDILKRIQEQGNKKSIFDIKSLEEDWQKTLSYRRLASNWNVPTSKKKKAKAPPGRGGRGRRRGVSAREGVGGDGVVIRVRVMYNYSTIHQNTAAEPRLVLILLPSRPAGTGERRKDADGAPALRVRDLGLPPRSEPRPAALPPVDDRGGAPSGPQAAPRGRPGRGGPPRPRRRRRSLSRVGPRRRWRG